MHRQICMYVCWEDRGGDPGWIARESNVWRRLISGGHFTAPQRLQIYRTLAAGYPIYRSNRTRHRRELAGPRYNRLIVYVYLRYFPPKCAKFPFSPREIADNLRFDIRQFAKCTCWAVATYLNSNSWMRATFNCHCQCNIKYSFIFSAPTMMQVCNSWHISRYPKLIWRDIWRYILVHPALWYSNCKCVSHKQRETKWLMESAKAALWISIIGPMWIGEIRKAIKYLRFL